MNKNRKMLIYYILASILGFFLVPFLVNVLTISKVPYFTVANNNDWISFFGSYISAIIAGVIGALVAVYVSKIQIEKQTENFKIQFDRDNYNYLITNRSYISVQEIIKAPFLLHNLNIPINSRIILTREYESFINNNSERYLKNQYTSFYKFTLQGIPSSVINCCIKIELVRDDDKENNHKIYAEISSLDKNEEVYIPLYIHSRTKEVSASFVEVSYMTLVGEYMLLEYNPANNIESYYSLGIDGQSKELIFTYKINTTNWIYPKKLSK